MGLKKSRRAFGPAKGGLLINDDTVVVPVMVKKKIITSNCHWVALHHHIFSGPHHRPPIARRGLHALPWYRPSPDRQRRSALRGSPHRPIAMDAAGAGGAAQPIAAGGRGGVPMDLPREYVSHWQDWDGA